MRISIVHRTEYSYDAPLLYGLQRLRLAPQSGSTQRVRNWSLSIEGATEELRFFDHYGNDTRLVSIQGEPHVITIVASGEVDTLDIAGIVGPHRGFVPLWLFEQETPLTAADKALTALARSFEGWADIERLHGLLCAVKERITYRPGATATGTTAAEALAKGEGVCQDHAHCFIAAARVMGFPARYVSGYLCMDDAPRQTASHAWAEAHVEGLGWVAFDPANGISADERYVRLAVGRDYREAAPVAGIIVGGARETLAVDITVEQ
jgi:transglutaminase-like putative cysteine protease